MAAKSNNTVAVSVQVVHERVLFPGYLSSYDHDAGIRMVF